MPWRWVAWNSEGCWAGDCFYVIEANDVEVQTYPTRVPKQMRPRGPGPAGNATGGSGTGHDGDHGQPIAPAPQRNLAMSDFQSSEPAISHQTVETVSANVSSLHVNVAPQLETPASPLSNICAIGRSRIPTVSNRCLNFN